MKHTLPLNTFPVFSVLETDVCERLLKDDKVHMIHVNAEELVGGNSIFCILQGTAAVYARNEVHPALIRYLNAGDIFGAAAIYAADPHLTTIIAQTKMTMLEVPRETVDLLLAEYPDFAGSYLCFLSDRIAFLNRRIAYVTAGTAQQRLAGWLLAVSGGEDTFPLPVNMSSLAKLLDLGRASLYRAFEELETAGLVERFRNTVEIQDRAALKALV